MANDFSGYGFKASQHGTCVELLRHRAQAHPEREAFLFLADGEVESDHLTYSTLDEKARQIAVRLQTSGLAGKRALLLYRAGLDFIAAFFGCLYAGVVAVPAYAPRRRKPQRRLLSIAEDCRPAVCLTTADVARYADAFVEQSEALKDVEWLATDDLDVSGSDWRAPAISPDTLAFLQYTSGSTGSPKGVMVSHRNLLHNEEMIRLSFGQDEDSVVVGWLPLYHDMGLIGNILQPLYLGARCVLMPPMAFLQRPLRWLRAISRYRGTTSGGPNFAYELCTARIQGEDRDVLDLSSWTVAFNGAEPVRAATLEAFAAAFADQGFRGQAFYPCYGLAEATLFVTGGDQDRAPTVTHLDTAALEREQAVEAEASDKARAHVGCGRIWLEQELRIVDPQTLRPRDDRAVGEIWLSGPSVAQGYWNHPEATARDFDARLHGNHEAGPFLRTGDLGFLDRGELFVTGRLKDLIIVRGRNLYPQDLELTAERSHSSLRPGCSAAFTLDGENEEPLALVLEVDRRVARAKDPDELERLAETVRHAISSEYAVGVHVVALIHPGTLPKTSSGKVRRRTCRAQYKAGELRRIGESRRAETPSGPIEAIELDLGTLQALEIDDRATILSGYLRQMVALRLGLPLEKIPSNQALIALGLDSLQAMEMRGELERQLGVAPEVTAFLDGASLDELTRDALEKLDRGQDDPLPSAGEMLGEYPLSDGQRALFFLHRLAPESSAYHIYSAAKISGELDVDAARQAFTQLVVRHPLLRVRFDDPCGEVHQCVLPPDAAILKVSLEEAAEWSEAEVVERLGASAHRPFDLASESLLRAELFRRGPESWVLLLVVHHLVADFWSLSILLNEFCTLYSAARNRTERYRKETGDAALPPVEHTYADFVRWQKDLLSSDAGRRLETFWLEHLGGDLEPLDLATDFPRPPIQTWSGAAASAFLPTTRLDALLGMGRERGATLYMVLLAAFQTLLHRYTGQSDLLVGSPSAGRTRPEFENLVGYFVNPLVLRTHAASHLTFGEFLGRARQSALAAFRHQDYPFERLVERLQPQRGLSRPPIFQVFLSLQQAPRLRAEGLDAFAVGDEQTRLVLAGLEWRQQPIVVRAAQFELALEAAVVGGGLSLKLIYNRDLFEPQSAERALGHLRQILATAARAPDSRLAEIDLLTPAERAEILIAWNESSVEAPRNTSFWIHHQIADQAHRTPDDTALICGEERLSYRELIQRSEALAGQLRSLGVRPDETVGLFVERSPEMVVGVLGILGAGAAYVPLDPSYPEERLRYMFDDATRGRDRRLLLTLRAKQDHPAGLGEIASQVLRIDDRHDSEGHRARTTPQPLDAVSIDGENLAYVIYTSGSTGLPKGVEIPHRAMLNFLESMRQRPGLSAQDTLLAVTTLAFDIAVLEVFLPLAVGGRLVLAERDATTTGVLLADEIARHGVTVMQATPVTWRLLLESGWQGDPDLTMLCGGEALPADLAASLAPCGRALWNMYGPTETTVWSAVREIPHGEAPIRVGGAIAQTGLYVLDPNLRPLPAGLPGEMWISGAGLARGYHGRPKLTAERFVPNPLTDLTEAADAAGGRLYRVGDRVKWRHDGTLEFLGRVDHQVKVRGYRIELGEIEAVLGRHPAVARAVVVRTDDHTDSRLVAYLMVEEGETPTPVGELRDFLHAALPSYMVPSATTWIETYPLTSNGKIDRSQLARQTVSSVTASDQARAPKSKIERVLGELWREVLGVESVSVDDNFFDLGGHSLLATRLHRLLAERLQRDDLTVVHLFQYPTIASLAAFLAPDDAASPSNAPPTFLRGNVEEDIAIIGMAGRFPGARDVESFWNGLRDGIELITFFADDDLEGVDPAHLNDARYVRARGVLEGAEDFDAAFFGFTPREAEILDPQHRQCLEVAYEALENAAVDPAREGGRIGLFAGVGLNTYLLHAGEAQLSALAGGYQAFIANDKDFVPTRISYKLNLRGPSVNVQTACSSSLVAVHLACQSLRTGEADMALAGGVTVRVPQQQGYLYEEGGILSADGHCRAFDENAGGTTLGNGVGLVVLKPLAAALADGHRILAVIKGSAINNDGSLKMGYTAPSVDGQTDVIRTALARAGVDPRTVGYIEAHGTGTALGDPIEVMALRQAFTQSAGTNGSARSRTCYLGSVKSNIGHLDTAAGVAGLIKAVSALDREAIPPTPHFVRPNTKLQLADGPFEVASKLVPWPRTDEPRRAGVSSFGIGGTNVHVVLEEAPLSEPSSPPAPDSLLILSAKSQVALETLTEQLRDHLAALEDTTLEGPALAGTDLADIAFTLQVGRPEHSHRRFVVVDNAQDAVQVLTDQDPERLRTGQGLGQRAHAGVLFLFSGQGSQYPGMGQDLYDTEPVFRSQIDRAAEFLQDDIGLDLRQLLFPSDGEGDKAAKRLRETRFTQPALFVVEYALARLWMAWGIRPQAMLGHSIGEFVAATLAGVFFFEDALSLVAARGRLMHEQPPGSMLALQASEADALPLLGEELSLAAVNGPNDIVVAGPDAAIDALASHLGDGARRLHTSHAFHSAMMHPAVEPLVERVKRCQLNAPSMPFVSSLTARWITDEEATSADYWGRQLAEPVRFADALATLVEDVDPSILLEVGPGRALATLARPQARDHLVLASLPHPRDLDGARRTTLNTLGRLWQNGVEIDWQSFYRERGENRMRVVLPSYPFDRRRFFLERGADRSAVAQADPLAKKAEIGDWFYAPVWKPSPTAPSALAENAEVWWILSDESMHELARACGAEIADEHREVVLGRLDDPEPHWDGLPGPPSRVVVLGPGEDLLPLVGLVKVLADLPGDGPIELNVVTRGTWKVQGGEVVDPNGALAWGLLQAMPQEIPRLRCRAIDITPAAQGADSQDESSLQEDVADLVLELATSPAARSSEIAWRDGERFARTYEPVRVPSAKTGANLRPGSTYLITGGLGGVGLALAHGLAADLEPGADGVRTRFVLIGRSAAPARETWPGSRFEALLELEALGIEVMTAAVDVADSAALSTVVETARQRFGPVRGVIHAAGVAGGGLLRLRQAEEIAAVLRPKVEGTRALLAVLDDEPLDFLIFCSSINAVAGGYGQADYCAANAYLDAAAGAARRGRRGPHVVSLGFDRFDGVGMARTPGGSGHPLLGQAVLRTPRREIYRAHYTTDSSWVLSEHLIAGRPTMPGASYLEMARAAMASRADGRPVELREVVFLEPLTVDPGDQREVLTLFEFEDDTANTGSFRVLSRLTTGDRRLSEHSRGWVSILSQDPESSATDVMNMTEPATIDLPAIRERTPERLTAEDAAARSSKGFLVTGRRWQGLESVQNGDGELLAEIILAEDLATDLDIMPLHPALLDIAVGCVQLVRDGDFLPLSYDRMSILGPLPERLTSYLRWRANAEGAIACDAWLLDPQGQIRAVVEGFSMRRLSAEVITELEKSEPPRPIADPSETAKPLEEVLLEGTIEAAQSVEVLRRVLGARVPAHLVVSPRDLNAVQKAYAAFDPNRIVGELAEIALPATAHARPDLGTDYVAPDDDMQKVVAEVWRRYLGLEAIGAHDNFFELGGTSLVGVQVVGELKRRLGREVSTVSLFEAPTVAALAKLLTPEDDPVTTFAGVRNRASKKKAALRRTTRARRRRPMRTR